MNKQFGIISIVLLASLAVLGAGCGKKEVVSKDGKVNADVLATLSPEEATKQIVFKAGSNFLIQQRAVQFEDRIIVGEPKTSQRVVNVTSFIPKSSAEVEWKLSQLVPAEASTSTASSTEAAAPSFGQVESAGTVKGIDFFKSHKITLPIRWTVGDAQVRSSAVWVSDDVYRELSRTKNSTIYLDAVDTANEVTLSSADLQKTVSLLREYVRGISENIEVDFMKAEGDLVDWPINVNGKDIKVQAIRAQDWFGEIVVLNNPENPLILKFEFNPKMEGADAGSTEMNMLRALLGFEITKIGL